MTKTFNFVLKIKGVVGSVAREKSSDPATPQKRNLERAQSGNQSQLNFIRFLCPFLYPL